MIVFVLAGLGVVAAIIGYWAGYTAGESKGFRQGFDACLAEDAVMKELCKKDRSKELKDFLENMRGTRTS